MTTHDTTPGAVRRSLAPLPAAGARLLVYLAAAVAAHLGAVWARLEPWHAVAGSWHAVAGSWHAVAVWHTAADVGARPGRPVPAGHARAPWPAPCAGRRTSDGRSSSGGTGAGGGRPDRGDTAGPTCPGAGVHPRGRACRDRTGVRPGFVPGVVPTLARSAHTAPTH